MRQYCGNSLPLSFPRRATESVCDKAAETHGRREAKKGNGGMRKTQTIEVAQTDWHVQSVMNFDSFCETV